DLVHFFAVKGIQADDLWAEDVFNDDFDRRLSFPVGVRARWGISCAGDSGVSVNPHHNVVCGRDLTRSKFQWLRVWNRIGDSFNSRDLQSPSQGLVCSIILGL